MTIEEIKQKCDNKEAVNISTPEDYNNMILYLIANNVWDKSKGYRIFNIANAIDFNGGNIELMYQDTNANFIELNGNGHSIKNAFSVDEIARNRCLLSVWGSEINNLKYEKCNITAYFLEILRLQGESIVDIFSFENNRIEVNNGYQFAGGAESSLTKLSTNSYIKISGGDYRCFVGINAKFIANLDEVVFAKSGAEYCLSGIWGNSWSNLKYCYARPKINLMETLGLFYVFNRLGDNSTQCYFAPEISDITKLPNSLELTRTDLSDVFYEEEAFAEYTGTKNGNSIPSTDPHSLNIMRARGWNA